MGESRIVDRCRHALRAVALFTFAAVTTAALPASAQQRLTDEDLDRYRGIMTAGDTNARVAAADALGRRGSSRRTDVLPILREHLRSDAEWRVRASSGRAIGRLAARDAVPDLVRALRDPVVDVRVVAAAALWRLPDPAAVQPLLELLRDQEPAARQWAALALGVIRDRRATRPLITLLRDPERDVRLDAIRSLGRLRDPDGLRALEAFARNPQEQMEERLEAINALSTLDGPDKINALVRLLGESDAQIRQRAVQALGRVGDALVLPPLRQRRAAERDGDVRTAIDEAIQAIQGRASGNNGSEHPLNLPPLP
ncbi:MAG: HEAT repeat domain-containing protein [Sandaracinaceae bacterium]|nr:HEAT repeat domain-containing protein [Sandaracinaceae bacterium]